MPHLKIISLATRWKKTHFCQRETNNSEFGPAVETRLISEAGLAISGSASSPQNLVQCNCIYMGLKIYTAI